MRTRLEIYRAALKQAAANGFAPDKDFEALTNDALCAYYVGDSCLYFTEVFRTDFAKAFWGEHKINYLQQEVHPIDAAAGRLDDYTYAYSVGDNKQSPPFYTKKQYDEMQFVNGNC